MMLKSNYSNRLNIELTMRIKTFEKYFFYVLFCAALALTWFFHKDATRFSDRSEMWSDGAGYYICLLYTSDAADE